MALTAKKLDQVRATVPVETAGRGADVRVNINVPAATRKLWKTQALARDMTITEMVERAVTEYLSK